MNLRAKKTAGGWRPRRFPEAALGTAEARLSLEPVEPRFERAGVKG